MASKISVVGETVAKDKSIIPQKSGMMSFYILPHLHSTKPLTTYQTHQYPSPAPVLVAGVWGLQSSPQKSFVQIRDFYKYVY